MSISVVMPQLGLTMEEGTVTGWLKKPGDAVKRDEPLFTISTEKAEMDVESTVDGVLGEILIQAGDVVPVGTILAYIEGNSEDITVVGSEQPSAEVLQENAALVEGSKSRHVESQTKDRLSRGLDASQRRAVSPRARRLARELGVDIESIGDGKSAGPINEAAIRKAGSGQVSVPKSSGSHRQLIAERLTRSVQTIPTFSVSAEANAEKLLASYEGMKESILKSAGIKVTVTDLLLKIFALTLKASPALNALWTNNSVQKMSSIDIGLAVDTAKGVTAPVLRSVDMLDLQSLVTQRSELAEKARSGQLSLSQLEGGVTTLSNLGMYRVDSFTAIISPTQSSILAVGQIRKRPWVDVTLVIKPTIMLNLTVDHRVADGAAAAAFLSKMVEMVEDSDGTLWGTNKSRSKDGRER